MLIYNKHHILFPYDPQISLPTKHMVPGSWQFSSFHAATAIMPPPQATPFFAQAWFAAYSGAASISDHSTSEIPELPPHSNLTEVQQELLVCTKG